MPIKPEDAKKLSEGEIHQLHTLIEEIDIELRARYAGHPITFSLPSSLSERARLQLIKDYEEVGWTVKYHSEQRDGDWLEFKENIYPVQIQ